MSDLMTQQEAMNMSNEQAVQILIPMRNMMCDQYGCPISDAVFALDKAIEALSADAVSREMYCELRKDTNKLEGECIDLQTEIECLKEELADSVKVVRCKECRHYEKFNYEAPSGYDGWCNTPVIYADGHYTNALHFCSWGERIER